MTYEPPRVPTRADGGSVWDDGKPTPEELSVVDWLLTTTRATRRTLDLDRPVDLSVIEDCLDIALQAPVSHNDERWHWLIVTDPEKRAALADMYKRAWEASTAFASRRNRRISGADQSMARSQDSAIWLAEHIHEVPVMVVPCITGPSPEEKAAVWWWLMKESGISDEEMGAMNAAHWGSIFPAAWSFQLALRARGLGTVMTVMHLSMESQAAKVLELPPGVVQAGLMPVAHLTRTVFKSARRKPLETRLSYDTWHGRRPEPPIAPVHPRHNEGDQS
jgi:nitroreductase